MATGLVKPIWSELTVDGISTTSVAALTDNARRIFPAMREQAEDIVEVSVFLMIQNNILKLKHC